MTQDTPPQTAWSTLLIFLIVDVRGYSTFTYEQGDEAAARLADRFADIAKAVVTEFNGSVTELQGDQALCVFASARNAFRCAVALQDVFKEAVLSDPSLPLNVGIGLDGGDVVPVQGGYR